MNSLEDFGTLRRRQPPTDVIFVRDCKVQTLIGVHPQERQRVQSIRLDLDIGLAENHRWTSDKLSETIDYAAVVQRLRTVLEHARFRLVETLAEYVGELILDEFGACWVRVRAAKVSILADVGEVGVCIERERARRADSIAGQRWSA